MNNKKDHRNIRLSPFVSLDSRSAVELHPVTPTELFALQRDWNELLQRSSSDTVFLRWEWVSTWWRCFSAGKELMILAASLDGRLVGIAPFYTKKEGPWGRRCLRLCSDEVSPDYLDVIIEQGKEEAVLNAFQAFFSRYSGLWDVMVFDHVRPDSILLSWPILWSSLRSSVQTSHVCPFVRIDKTFERYLQEQETLKRFGLPAKLHKLSTKQGVTHRRINQPDAVKTALDELFRLHEMRSHDVGRETAFLEPTIRRFHYEVAQSFLEQNILNLQLLMKEEKAISAQYSFNYRNKVSFFQSGFDPQWSRWSVGLVLFYLTIGDAFRQGMEEFDFLKGDEAYKSLWANGTRQEWQIMAYSKTFASMCLWAVRHAKRFLSSRVIEAGRDFVESPFHHIAGKRRNSAQT